MEKFKLFSRLLIAMMAIAVFGTSCDSDDDDLNAAVPTYTITFETNGGTEIDAVETVGGKISEPATPVKEGSTFEGWYVDSEFEDEFDFGMTIIGNITLYAKWSTIASYTVTYYSSTDGYETLADTMIYYEYSLNEGDAITNDVDNPAGTVQYSFGGWYDTTDCTGDAYTFGSTADGDVVLYAKWDVNTFAVTFELEGGSYDGGADSLAQTVAYGDVASEPSPEPTYTNYEFIGWYTEASGAGTKWIFEDMPITEATTLYAYWAEDVLGTAYFYNDYITDFSDYESATAVREDKIISGSIISKPTTGTTDTDQYTFLGWYTAENFESGEAYTFADVLTEDGDVKLYAKWAINTYTLTITSLNGGELTSQLVGFTDNGDGTSSITVEYGATVEEPDAPTKDSGDVEFLGWYIDGVYSEDNLFQFGETEITTDIDIQALWRDPLGVVSYYNQVGAMDIDSYDEAEDLMLSDDVFTGDLLAPPTIDADPAGEYEFVGWFTEAGFSGTTSFDLDAAITAEGDIALYTKWEAKKYTVSFVTGEGTPISDIEVAFGDVIPTQTTTYTGHTLEGWFTDVDGDGDEYTLGESTMPVGELTLYAYWQIKTYTVTFSTEGYGTAPDDIEDVEHGSTIDVDLDEPTEYSTDVIFVGWYIDNTLETAFVVGETEVTDNMTLYAKWNKAPITITFDYNDGGATTATTSDPYSYDDTEQTYGYATAPTSDPTYADHTFIGWYVTPDEGETLADMFDFENDELTGSMTLTAKWWDNDGAEEFEIYNVTELCIFRDRTNLGSELSRDIKLMRDIDLSEVCSEELGNWTSIANSASNYYKGTFDGNERTISNLYHVGSTTTTGGLFAYIGEGTVIKNITMENPYIYMSSTVSGVIAATVTGVGGVYITNCITSGGSVRTTQQPAGILGNCINTTATSAVRFAIIENCHNQGTSITSTANFAGGITSRLYGHSTVDGVTTVSKIINCSNSGAIQSTHFAGGISGIAECNAEIIGCYNTGTVKATSNSSEGGGSGGIVAICGWSNTYLTTGGCKIISCYNTGTVTGVRSGGGILGYARRGYVDIVSCYNTGSVIASSTTHTKLFGGILGGYNSDAYSDTETTSPAGVDFITFNLASNYFVDDSADNATYGLGGYTTVGSQCTDDDVTDGNNDNLEPLNSISDLNGKIEEMNTAGVSALSASGYSVVFSMVSSSTPPTITVTEV